MVQLVTPDPTPRLISHLAGAARRYPKAWRHYDRFRAGREELGGWPDWCFAPLSASYAIVTEQHGIVDRPERLPHLSPDPLYGKDFAWGVLDVSKLGGLGAWRVTQGVYRIDPEVLDAVVKTPPSGTVPVDVLLRLPQWCVYVSVPEGYPVELLSIKGEPPRTARGFFAHLEHDAHDGRVELRLLHDVEEDGPWFGLCPEILHLIPGATVRECSEAAVEQGLRQIGARIPVGDRMDQFKRALLDGRLESLGFVMNLLLYLCSRTAEYRPGGERGFTTPSNPSPKKTKEGWRLFAPDRPRTWYVGERIGRQIRDGYELVRRHDAVERSGPRPHVRGAHWHGFWTGPRIGPRSFDLRWLPPIPVAMAEDTPEARMKAERLKPVRNLQDETNAAAQTLERKVTGAPDAQTD
jgi:hypothetical protein